MASALTKVAPTLSSTTAQHPLEVLVPARHGNARPAAVASTPSGYTPATIRAALGLTGTGVGQTIALVSAYDSPNAASDLAVFDATFKLPAPPSFKKMNQSGGSSYPAADAGWALESNLDVQLAHALAPAASLLLVEATSSSVNNLSAAIDYAARQPGVSVISNSWGISGEVSGESDYDYHCRLTKAVCVFSSGDSGWSGGYPAYNPYVISVGGTTLNLVTDPKTGAVTVAKEMSWSGSGGGVSQYESRPSYQSAVNPTAGRGIPDVSFAGDPATGFAVYDSTPYLDARGWFQMGGTSVGAPQWAAIFAVADQLRIAARKPVLAGAADHPGTSPYPAAAAIYGLRSGLSDVTIGPTNGDCGKVCTVRPGYDYVTGLGSPKKGIDLALAAA